MPTELGDALIAIDAIALLAFFAMIYSTEITALARRLRRWLVKSITFARFRHWFGTRKASN